MERIPVVYKKIPLMPTNWKKALRLIKSRQAKFQYDKDGNKYIKLLVDPSGYATQEINMGIDPGSWFDGISIVSKKCHHTNIELVHNKGTYGGLKKDGTPKITNRIKDKMKTRALNRRARRSNLRHRKIRFDNRTSEKLVPTVNSMVEFRKLAITNLCKIYPITKIIIENVKYNHFKSTNGSSFSQAEQGKTKLYKWIQDILKVNLELYDGFNTKKLRISYFKFDPKVKDKGSKSFEAHCIDSFVLACNKEFRFNSITGEVYLDEPCVVFKGLLNKSVKFISKIIMYKRKLHRTRSLIKQAKEYFIWRKGGIKEYFVKLGKPNICRVKTEGIHSNHPKKWVLKCNKKAICLKHTKERYGGTIAFGKSESLVPRGISKKAIWKGKILGYQNRSYLFTH